MSSNNKHTKRQAASSKTSHPSRIQTIRKIFGYTNGWEHQFQPTNRKGDTWPSKQNGENDCKHWHHHLDRETNAKDADCESGQGKINLNPTSKPPRLTKMYRRTQSGSQRDRNDTTTQTRMDAIKNGKPKRKTKMSKGPGHHLSHRCCNNK